MIKHTLLACMLAVGGLAQARFVGIEPVAAGGEARACFGAWADDVRETAAGSLKRVTAPRGMSSDGAIPPVTRHDDPPSFRPAGSGDARLAGGDVSDQRVASLCQARSGRTETAPRHPLELVPTAAGANTLTLRLAGRPLAKTAGVLFGPPTWQKTFRTDEAGRVALATLATPWPGRYMAEGGPLDRDAPGSWDGKAHPRTRHVATLAFGVP